MACSRQESVFFSSDSSPYNAKGHSADVHFEQRTVTAMPKATAY